MDIKEYIENRLLEMQNLEDRKLMRQVLGEVILPLYQYSEERYKELEKKILEEIQGIKPSYDIITGIVDRKKFDITSTFMKLMQPEDIEEKIVDLSEVKSALMQGRTYCLFSVFIKADYPMIRNLMVSDRKFEGAIRTREGEYKARFQLKKKVSYLEQLHQLYRVFLHNAVPWKTVCAPYLHKIFDVYLCETEPLDGDEIEEIIIRFEEYEPFIRYNYVPIWNLEMVQIRTNALPFPCEDQIHYQHQIYKEKLDNGDYLIMNTDIPILDHKRVEGDLIITCKEDLPVEWSLLKFNPETNLSYEELLMNNHGDLPSERSIRTRAAIERFIASLGYVKYFMLKDIRVYRGTLSNGETYSMDDFIEDETMLKDNQNTLEFEFTPLESDSYLMHDILSYIITRLQREYPEYQCVGRFV